MYNLKISFETEKLRDDFVTMLYDSDSFVELENAINKNLFVDDNMDEDGTITEITVFEE